MPITTAPVAGVIDSEAMFFVGEKVLWPEAKGKPCPAFSTTKVLNPLEATEASAARDRTT